VIYLFTTSVTIVRTDTCPDLNGNLQTNGTRTFDYDDENQLTRVTEPNKWKSEFVYDGKMRRRVRKEFTWDTTGGTATELITSVTAGGVRNNFDGWVGFKFVTGDRPMSVTHLGRYVLSGNGAAHTVKIVKPDGSDLSGASVSVPTSGATAGQYTYAALSSPVTLAPNSAYFIVSGETSGGDTWYEYNTALTPGVGTVGGPVFGNYSSTNYTDNSAFFPGWSYVPPGLKYSGSWLQTNEVHYVYDGNVVIQERDANNLPQVTYTRGKDLSGSRQRAGGIGGLLARTDNRLLTASDSGASAYYHSDGSGNITALINTNQNLVGRYLYDPFGNILSQSGPLADANTYRFSSKEWHPNSGLSYYLRRYYSPDLHRWLNGDPALERGGNNLFGFVGNAPLNRLDRIGLAVEPSNGSPIGVIIGGIFNGINHALDSTADFIVDASHGIKDERSFSDPLPLIINGINLDGPSPVRPPIQIDLSEPSTADIMMGGLWFLGPEIAGLNDLSRDPCSKLLGHTEYIIGDADKALQSQRELLEFYAANADNPGIDIVEGLIPNGTIDTVSGRISISGDLIDRFPHLVDGVINEELWHFKQLYDGGLYGKTVSPKVSARFEAEIVDAMLGSGFRIQ
jgi:RHS repeat-associated protein